VSQCQKKSTALYGAKEDNRGRHTDNPAGRHSIRTNQQPTSLIPQFLRPSCRNPQFILAWDRHQIFVGSVIHWLWHVSCCMPGVNSLVDNVLLVAISADTDHMPLQLVDVLLYRRTTGVQTVRSLAQLITRYVHHILSLFNIVSFNWNALGPAFL